MFYHCTWSLFHFWNCSCTAVYLMLLFTASAGYVIRSTVGVNWLCFPLLAVKGKGAWPMFVLWWNHGTRQDFRKIIWCICIFPWNKERGFHVQIITRLFMVQSQDSKWRRCGSRQYGTIPPSGSSLVMRKHFSIMIVAVAGSLGVIILPEYSIYHVCDGDGELSVSDLFLAGIVLWMMIDRVQLLIFYA